MFENKTKIFFQCGKRHKKNKEKIKYFIILVRTFLFVSFNPEGSDVHFMYYYKQHKSNRPLHCFACYLLPTNCKRKKVIYITKYPTNFEPCSSKKYYPAQKAISYLHLLMIELSKEKYKNGIG